MEELVAQRVLALTQGYEQLNDHGALCNDALLALAVGQGDFNGAQRRRVRDRARMPWSARARSIGWSERQRSSS